MNVARLAAGWLERPGAGGEGWWERLLSRAPRVAAARVVRPLDFDPARVIGVGGATLGGSGKTPLAIAIASAIAARGGRVVFVGHAYGACPREAREVGDGDRLDEVGDDAILATRALGLLAARERTRRVPVVVAPSRREAVALAARLGDVLVIDRLLQARPRPLACAVLAVDGERPWGSGRCLPFGDLVAPRATLLSAADLVVAVGSADARIAAVGVWRGDRQIDFDALRGQRVGLVTSVAHPERVVELLRQHGVVPIVHSSRADHSPLARGEPRVLARVAARHALDLWISDSKGALQLPRCAGVPIVRLEIAIDVAPALVERILARVSPARKLASIAPP